MRSGRWVEGQGRANEAGCLDQCEHGGGCGVPRGSLVWFVKTSDVREIVVEHLVNGRPVNGYESPTVA